VRQGEPILNASFAAATALLISSSSPSETWAITSSEAGLTMGIFFFETLSTYSLLIKS
jgi:hypothetical protein